MNGCKNKGAVFVKYYLLHRDIKFNPMKPPPMTAAKQRMAAYAEKSITYGNENCLQRGANAFPI